jgi:hypothetical protein
MLNFCRHTLAGLTIAALASFPVANAQNSGQLSIRDNAAWTVTDGVVSSTPASAENPLFSRASPADSVTSFDFRVPKGAKAQVYLQGRYALDLPGTGEWQTAYVRFRAPRLNEAYQKEENALLLEARIGTETRRNIVIDKPSAGARWEGEDHRGPAIFQARETELALRNVRHESADFAQIKVPASSGGDSNEKELMDLVELGKELFTSVGCEACHQVAPNSTAVSSGPNLFGLVRSDPRAREVVEGGEGRRFQVRVGREYLHRSVRAPAEQLAVAELGPTRGQPYLPVMMCYTSELIRYDLM